MITDFKKWSLVESFGNGEETFTEEIDLYGKARNLDLTFPPGWEVEDASGKLTYTARLDVRRGGIQDIIFTIDKIEIEVEHRVFEGDEDEDGKLETREFVFDKNNMGTDPKIEVHSLPFYLHTLEIDFRYAEDVDGEMDMKKVKFQMDIGHIE